VKIVLKTGEVLSDLPSTADAAAQIVGIENDAGLEGYQHALPLLASIGGYAYLREYQHATWPWLVNGGADSRGYWFTGMHINGEWRIRAGCRDFTIDRSLRHWGSGGQSDRPDCLALVEKIIAEIKVRTASIAEAA
jgi:hypothetical protein